MTHACAKALLFSFAAVAMDIYQLKKQNRVATILLMFQVVLQVMPAVSF